jgi:hypothetical protein
MSGAGEGRGVGEDEKELPELIAPEEGLGTLMAQITRGWVDRLVRLVRQQREKGVPDDAIAKALRHDLPEFDAHTRRRVMDLAAGGPIPDDFPAEAVTASAQPKPNTVELTVSGVRPDLGQYSLVRYHGTEWLVSACQGDCWTLKLLE